MVKFLNWDDKEALHGTEVYIAVVAALTLGMLIGGYFMLR